MTAIAIPQPGGPECLIPESRSVPAPAPGEVLVKVAAAGLNRPDIMQRQGTYPPPKGVSDIPGLEIAGTIVALGNAVSGLKLGDQVCALVSGGGYAQYCPVPAVQCLPIPKGLSLVEAASLPESFFTVWSNLLDRGHLQKGETLLIHGGTSGIGVSGIQIAKALGATVYVTAGSAEKCAASEALGAKKAVNYQQEDFVEVLKEETGGKGIDVILDIVGGDYIPRNISLLAKEGRLINIAYQKGAKMEVNFLPVMLKRLTITGSTLRIRETEYKGTIAQGLKKNVWPLLEEGSIKPQVYATFPFRDARSAHELMESSAHIGKIVLTMESAPE